MQVKVSSNALDEYADGTKSKTSCSVVGDASHADKALYRINIHHWRPNVDDKFRLIELCGGNEVCVVSQQSEQQ